MRSRRSAWPGILFGVFLGIIFALAPRSIHVPPAAVVPLIFLSPWLLGPLAIYMGQWYRIDVPLVSINLAEADFVGRIRQDASELKLLGFVYIGGYRRAGAVPNVTGQVVVYFHPQTGDVAKIIGAMAQQKSAVYLVFTAHLDDGREVHTSNSSTPPVTPAYPGTFPGQIETLRFSQVESAARLYRIHRARVDGSRQNRPNLDDPVAYQEMFDRRVRDHWVASGYYYLGTNGTHLYPTLKGALLMTWKALWPVPALRRLWWRYRAAHVIRELGLAETFRAADRNPNLLHDDLIDGASDPAVRDMLANANRPDSQPGCDR